MRSIEALESPRVRYLLQEYLNDTSNFDTALGPLSLCSSTHMFPHFDNIDGLLLPNQTVVKLSNAHASNLFTASHNTKYYGPSIGWGVEAGQVLPKHALLFAYYGEFISTAETGMRHRRNEEQKVDLLRTSANLIAIRVYAALFSFNPSHLALLINTTSQLLRK